ncbi:MAG: DUF2125 domain-containing protein [Rhodobacterales bacterium]|nr:DUF2125 domain-containing protein [Rhodobacterales bacterium]MDX5500906.1 DUF2125 domain-containing protein [Rhodobacterales bacterium]
MSLLRKTRFAGVILLTGVLPVQADISPEQAWAVWQDLAGNLGYSLTAESQRREGDRLVLDRVLGAMVSGTAELRAPVAQVVLRDRGDGTVEVTISPSIEMSMKVNEPDSEPVDMTMRLDQSGYIAIISGSADAPKLDFTAQSMTISQIPPKVDGKEVPMTMTATLTGLRGGAALTPGQTTDVTYDFSADTLDAKVDATNPDDAGTMLMTMRAQGLTAAFTGAVPPMMAPGAELPAMLNAGLRGSGSYSTGPTAFAFNLNDKGASTQVNGTLSGTAVDFGLTPAGLSYSARLSGLDLTAEGDNVPFPEFRVTAREYRLGLTMPLTKSETPSDFAFLMRLADLTLPEGVWAMVDPQNRLPRDPATVELDTAGKATLFADLTSTAAQEPDAEIGQIDALTVNSLHLRAAGAELTGTGAFTFDNSDMETIPGMPRPAGSADLKLTGGNTLLDNLVALGLVPEDQVMGIRMMLALFARPGEGPDTLTSKIEMTPEGQILANGQRIQ